MVFEANCQHTKTEAEVALLDLVRMKCHSFPEVPVVGDVSDEPTWQEVAELAKLHVDAASATVGWMTTAVKPAPASSADDSKRMVRPTNATPHIFKCDSKDERPVCETDACLLLEYRQRVTILHADTTLGAHPISLIAI